MKLSFRYAIAAIVMAGALFLLSPTLMPEDVNLPGASRISLGLDLKGGVQLTLGVDTEKAVQSALINSGQVLRQTAREPGLTVHGPRQKPGGEQHHNNAPPRGSWRAFCSLHRAGSAGKGGISLFRKEISLPCTLPEKISIASG